jgi:hypothetical protein
MEEVMEMLALVITGPMVGVEIAVATFTNPIIARLPDDAFRDARSEGSRVLGKVMPFWYIATLVVLIAAAVVSHSVLIAVAAGLMAAVVLLTVTMLVPINNRIGAWTQSDGPSRDLAGRWDRLHWLRVAVLVALFVVLVIAAV